jgi:myosin heavy subunit
MADGKIEIDTAINTDGAEKGVKSLGDKIKQAFSKNNLSAVGNLGMAVSGIGVAFKAATAIIGGTIKTMAAMTNAAITQQKAEIQLTTAIKNNPYVDGTAAKRLKEFAGEMQSVSEIGDEQLLPMMAQVISTGRTEAETMNLVRAAIDLSASGTMSLESAMTQLNATYSGNLGLLGRQIPQLKDLTEEELKNGKAVEIVSKNYGGMAESTTSATGRFTQLKNAWGDLMETFGGVFLKIASPIAKVLTGIVNGLNAATQKTKDFFSYLFSLEEEEASNYDPSQKLEAANKKREESLKLLDQEQLKLQRLKVEYEEILNSEEERAKAAEIRQATEKANLELTEAQKKNAARLKELTEARAAAEERINKANADIKGLKSKTYTDESGSTQYYTKDEQKERAKEIERIKKEIDRDKKYLNATYLEFNALNVAAVRSSELVAENTVKTVDSSLTAQVEAQEKRVKTARKEAEQAKKDAESAQREYEEHKKALEEADSEESKAMKKRDELRAEYDATISAKEKEIAVRKAAGEEISRETEAQELYNTALGAYVKMMSDPAFEGNSGTYEHEVKAREYIGEQSDIIKTKETEEAYRELSEQIQATANEGAKSIREQYDALIEELEKEFERVTGLELSDDGSIANIEDANSQELELYQQLQDAKVRANEEANEKIKQKNADSLASNAELVNSFVTQFSDITGQMTNLMRENLNAETAKETADLDQQYSDGLISYEEYCDKKAEIDKKAAREEYKIKMIEWTMQLAQAAANIAEGMTKALAQNGYPLGAIMAGLAAASGALQIATIVANKPKPPAFATGGIVGGNSYTGDNVIARVNSGERILTQAQSKALENSIASLGSGGGGVSMNVKIINNASDEVRAQSRLDMDGLKITVDKLVNTSFQQGNYTDSMNIAQSRQNGVKIL